jgi:hypothetical protein
MHALFQLLIKTRTNRTAVEERVRKHSREFYLGTGQTKGAFDLARDILTKETAPERLAREKEMKSPYERRILPRKLNTEEWRLRIVEAVEKEAGGASFDINAFGNTAIFSRAWRALQTKYNRQEEDEEFPNWSTGLGTHIKTVYCQVKKIALAAGGTHRVTASVDFRLNLKAGATTINSINLEFCERVPAWPSQATVEKEANEAMIGDRDADLSARHIPVEDLIEMQRFPAELVALRYATVLEKKPIFCMILRRPSLI